MTLNTTTSSPFHLSAERAAKLPHGFNCDRDCDVLIEVRRTDYDYQRSCQDCYCGCWLTSHGIDVAGCDDRHCPCANVWARVTVDPPLPAFIRLPLVIVGHDADWEEAHP
jgi:hypothetical protein